MSLPGARIGGLLLLAAAALGGCNVVGDIYAARLEELRDADYAWSTRPGNNTLTGRAVSDATTSTPGPCAGPVTLLPDGAYMQARSGSGGNPYVPPEELHDRGLTYGAAPVTPEAAYLARRTVCDAQGAFAFANLPDGAYILFATAADGREQIRKRIRLSGGHTLSLDLRHTCKDLPRTRTGYPIPVCGVAPMRVRRLPSDPNF